MSVLTENMYSNLAIGEGDMPSVMKSKKIVLCTFDIFEGFSKKTVDLGYFPISYNIFTSWFLKNVVDRGMQVYPFDQFLKDFINDCVLENIQKIDEWQTKFKTFSSPTLLMNKTYNDRTIEITYTDLPS